MADQQHYFTANPAIDARAKQVEFREGGQQLILHSAAGVFSAEHLDGGTRILLDVMPTPAAGTTVLDLGTGYGPIACVLGLRQPAASIWAVDLNERALELTRRNAADLGLTGLHAGRPDQVPAELMFDAIYSNPPIRIGKAALHELLLTWLARLRVDGHAYLVVQKNLGSDSLQRWLIEQGYPTDRMTSVRGFRVLDVTRPASEDA